MPWLQSSTVSDSGHRVRDNRSLRSSRTAAGTSMRYGLISGMGLIMQAATIADCHQVRGDTSDARSQDVPRRPAHVVARRGRRLDRPKLIASFRLELEDNAALVERFRLQHDVVLTAAMDVGNRVTWPQCLHGHQLGISG